MRLLLDMTMPAEWKSFLATEGWDTVHLSEVAPRPVTDAGVMMWAREYDRVLFTHNLDFGAVLECAGELGPSVFQVVARDIMVPQIGGSVMRALRHFEEQLEEGVLVLIDLETARARVVSIPISAQEMESVD